MEKRGVLIPGLSMAASELEQFSDFLALENPEVGTGQMLPVDAYSLLDLAKIHAEKIAAAFDGSRFEESQPLLVVGISMGGMIASHLATDLRQHLPKHCRFAFLVTSANIREHPAIPERLLTEWSRMKGEQLDAVRPAFAPLFSPDFLKDHPERFDAYCEYRIRRGNRQTAKSFYRQVQAIQRFDGAKTFAALRPNESLFISGSDDQLFGPPHAKILGQLAPAAEHRIVAGLGHMIHLERPDLLQAASF
ncbi:alpha/beta hydrolase fold protein [Planctomyces bekefii]|uniref:Alpha/beta hydrolase fold protein n=1 Tax=Planctomyces bekefii TaxID=1653850 RepID=A0A5C6MAI8_9PLAN|nr:alpha/beta hydrolase fold protein [Planctomyces bekefii]